MIKILQALDMCCTIIQSSSEKTIIIKLLINGGKLYKIYLYNSNSIQT